MIERIRARLGWFLYDLRCAWGEFKTNAAMFIAWKLTPRWLAYWCFVRVAAHATTGRFGSDETTAITLVTAMKRWDQR